MAGTQLDQESPAGDGALLDLNETKAATWTSPGCRFA